MVACKPHNDEVTSTDTRPSVPEQPRLLSSSHQPLISYNQARNVEDNWAGVTDPKERRKRQNRLHQREWRKSHTCSSPILNRSHIGLHSTRYLDLACTQQPANRPTTLQGDARPPSASQRPNQKSSPVSS